jgi:glycosyltransferase involved in cell wall biosynthesis
MWEYSTLGNLKGKSTFKSRVKNFDALVGYTDVCKGAFEGYSPKKLPMGVLQGGFNPNLWSYLERDWHSPRFSFIMNGQLSDRKNPWVAIAAFQELKDEYPEEFEPAELHLHNTVPSIPPIIEEAIPKLRLHYQTFSTYEMQEFYRSGHVLLAPSKGEGKNLPALEMLSTGGSVIYTDWGGHRNWGSDLYAYPLKYEMMPIGSSRYPDCMWAEADKEDLKRIMLHCFRNREEVKQKGWRGSQFVPEAFSWDAVMDQFFRLLPGLVPGKGHEIKLKYDEAIREASRPRGGGIVQGGWKYA